MVGCHDPPTNAAFAEARGVDTAFKTQPITAGLHAGGMTGLLITRERREILALIVRHCCSRSDVWGVSDFFNGPVGIRCGRTIATGRYCD